MNLKKIAICLVMIVAYSVICLNMHALASSSTTTSEFNIIFNSNKNNTNTNSGDTIEMVNGTTTGNNATVNNAAVNSANNAPGQLANTGLEDLPLLVILLLGISTVYAYNKIKEYKQY